jgi:hypothetical protein
MTVHDSKAKAIGKNEQKVSGFGLYRAIKLQESARQSAVSW